MRNHSTIRDAIFLLHIYLWWIKAIQSGFVSWWTISNQFKIINLSCWFVNDIFYPSKLLIWIKLVIFHEYLSLSVLQPQTVCYPTMTYFLYFCGTTPFLNQVFIVWEGAVKLLFFAVKTERVVFCCTDIPHSTLIWNIDCLDVPFL